MTFPSLIKCLSMPCVVVRFTRDEIIALRKPTRVIPDMLDVADVVTNDCLKPVLLKPIDPEEVIKIW